MITQFIKEHYVNIGAVAISLIVVGGSSFYYLNNKNGVTTTENTSTFNQVTTTGTSTQDTGTPTIPEYKNEPKQEPVKGVDGFVSYLYTTSGDKIFYVKEEIVGANTATFTVDSALGDGMAKDNVHVYFGGKVIEGADPATFTLVPSTFFLAKDSKNVYFIEHKLDGWAKTRDNQQITNLIKNVTVVKGADPKTFKVTANSEAASTTPVTLTTTATDGKAIYTVVQERYECYGNPTGCIGNVTLTSKRR